MKKIVVILFLVNIFCFLSAEFSFDRPTPNFNPNFSLGSFMSPDNVKMSHSMSFMSGVSSRGDGFYQSAYTNHLQFKLKQNLNLNLDLSLVNLGTMSHQNDLTFKGNNDNQNVFVPAFSLEYKPWENTTFYFEYKQVRGHSSAFQHHSQEWWRN